MVRNIKNLGINLANINSERPETSNNKKLPFAFAGSGNFYKF